MDVRMQFALYLLVVLFSAVLGQRRRYLFSTAYKVVVFIHTYSALQKFLNKIKYFLTISKMK